MGAETKGKYRLFVQYNGEIEYCYLQNMKDVKLVETEVLYADNARVLFLERVEDREVLWVNESISMSREDWVKLLADIKATLKWKDPMEIVFQ